MKNKEGKIFIYKGSSMYPTFKQSDLLYVVPYKDGKIKCGDVIVFKVPGKMEMVVHRIISINEEGIRTKGDNNKNIDPYVLNPCDIVGKVVYGYRGNKKIKIYGPNIAKIILLIKKILLKIDKIFSKIFRYPYCLFSERGILRLFLPFSLRPRIIRFRKENGYELVIVMGRKAIGRYISQRQKWEIKKPFRIFLGKLNKEVKNDRKKRKHKEKI